MRTSGAATSAPNARCPTPARSPPAGAKINGTETRSGGNLTCTATASQNVTDAALVIGGGLCAIESAATSNQAPLLGAYLPKCDPEGNFQRIQCHASTGYCFCVDLQTGRAEQVTRHASPGAGPLGKRALDLPRCLVPCPPCSMQRA